MGQAHCVGARAALSMLTLMAFAAPVVADAVEPLPIIVTYEMKKARIAQRTEARNPKRFWMEQIVGRIENAVAASPLHLKDPVTVQIDFTLGRDGSLVSNAITKSSGIPAADAAATHLLERAAPFPPMPETMREAQLSFVLPVRFR